jgi:hypothetical protein
MHFDGTLFGFCGSVSGLFVAMDRITMLNARKVWADATGKKILQIIKDALLDMPNGYLVLCE